MLQGGFYGGFDTNRIHCMYCEYTLTKPVYFLFYFCEKTIEMFICNTQWHSVAQVETSHKITKLTQ